MSYISAAVRRRPLVRAGRLSSMALMGPRWQAGGRRTHRTPRPLVAGEMGRPGGGRRRTRVCRTIVTVICRGRDVGRRSQNSHSLKLVLYVPLLHRHGPIPNLYPRRRRRPPRLPPLLYSTNRRPDPLPPVSPPPVGGGRPCRAGRGPRAPPDTSCSPWTTTSYRPCRPALRAPGLPPTRTSWSGASLISVSRPS